jgi:MFS family permease
VTASMSTRGVFFGWWVALSFAVMAFLSSGIRFAVGPFLKPMVADLGLDRASFSLVIALGLLLFGALQPFVGRLVDRLGARPVLVGGAVLLGASLAATGLATRLWHLYLFNAFGAALGLAATGQVVGAAVISRWFTRRRATALSLIGSASMAGITLMVPVAMWGVLTIGWRETYVVFGIAVVVLIVPMSLWLVRESPEAMGLTPDGLPPAGRTGEVLVERTALADALQTTPFWQLAGGLFCCGFSMSLLSAHGVPMLTDHGYHPMVASWALGLLGGSSIGFAFVLGMLSDRFGRRPVLAWVYGTRALIFLGLLLVRDQPAVLLLIAIVGGASMSGSLAAASALSAEIFGRLSVGSVYGTMFLFHQTGSALGSWLSGALFEATGGYGAAFGVASGLLLGASVLSAFIDERRPASHPSSARDRRLSGVPRAGEVSEGASRSF